MVLHKEKSDGTFEHVEFTRESWESGLRDPLKVRMWTHGEVCEDVVAKELERIRARSPKLTIVPEPVPAPEVVPTEWPPQQELTAWMLSHMTTLGIDDARDILRGPRKIFRNEPKPITDRKGQFMLF